MLRVCMELVEKWRPFLVDNNFVELQISKKSVVAKPHYNPGTDLAIFSKRGGITNIFF